MCVYSVCNIICVFIIIYVLFYLQIFVRNLNHKWMSGRIITMRKSLTMLYFLIHGKINSLSFKK